MFSLFGPLGLPEMLIILAIVILIFGANRLPELGKGIGAGIKNFKSSMKEGRREVGALVYRTRRTSPVRLVTRSRSRYSSSGIANFLVTPYRSLNAATSTVARPPGALPFSAATSSFSFCSASAWKTTCRAAPAPFRAAAAPSPSRRWRAGASTLAAMRGGVGRLQPAGAIRSTIARAHADRRRRPRSPCASAAPAVGADQRLAPPSGRRPPVRRSPARRARTPLARFFARQAVAHRVRLVGRGHQRDERSPARSEDAPHRPGDRRATTTPARRRARCTVVARCDGAHARRVTPATPVAMPARPAASIIAIERRDAVVASIRSALEAGAPARRSARRAASAPGPARRRRRS